MVWGAFASMIPSWLGASGLFGGKDHGGGGPAYPAGYEPITPDWLRGIFEDDPLIGTLMSQYEQYGGMQFNLPKFANKAQLGTQYTEQLTGQAQKQADIASQGASSALAARGGGGLGTALSLAAQARTQPLTEAISQGAGLDIQAFQAQSQKNLQDYYANLAGEQARFGAGMDVLGAEQDALLSALTFKYNVLNQILSGQLGLTGAVLQHKAAREQAKASELAGLFQGVGSFLGGALGG